MHAVRVNNTVTEVPQSRGPSKGRLSFLHINEHESSLF